MSVFNRENQWRESWNAYNMKCASMCSHLVSYIELNENALDQLKAVLPAIIFKELETVIAMKKKEEADFEEMSANWHKEAV